VRRAHPRYPPRKENAKQPPDRKEKDPSRKEDDESQEGNPAHWKGQSETSAYTSVPERINGKNSPST
jgi:hypothetical protein